MVDYNPKEWISLVFSLTKADTVRKLMPLMISITIYTSILAVLILEYWRIGENTDLKNISLMHSLLGFVISMLLVFRTNTAYDRWWEGRKQWGSLVNNSRNLALKINTLLGGNGHEKEIKYFKNMIPNYAYVLKNHLRKNRHTDELEESEGFPISYLHNREHLPNVIAGEIYTKIISLQKDGVISPEELLFLKDELQSFTDICGACERIRNTPIPYSYSSFLKKFITFYSFTLPVGYVFSLHYLVIPFVCFIFYVLASLEVIAEEIEDPFGTDANDLPLERICENIKKSVGEIFERK